MDKINEFSPSKEEATELADKYWSDLSDYNEKKLEYIKDAIIANAKSGEYKLVVEVLKGRENYIKEKLEEVGYEVTINNTSINEKNLHLTILFGK